ncbi:ParB family protein [Vibrio cholerae]|nr:ParB family protein [Vibrio cholerae]
MTKRGLGKGLDALLATSSLAREKQQVASLSQSMSAEGELAASIQSQGIIQPIVVRHLPTGGYEIIAGERRWRAAKQAGLKQVPCLIKQVEDRGAIAMALIENIQREDLNAMEEAQALERLQNEFNLTHQQVAEVIGKSRTTVTNLLRLNQLSDDVKRLLETKHLEMGHARALLMLEGEQQVEIAQQVAKKQLTVRQTEQLVKKCLSDPSDAKNVSEDLEIQQLSQNLSEKLAAKVSIVRTPNGKSKVTISLDEPHKLELLIAKLQN